MTPTLSDLHSIVIPKVTNKWYKLGLQLLDSSQEIDLDKIRLTYSNDSQKACVEMVKYWLKNTSDATWDSLIHALRTPGLELLATADDVVKQRKVKG